MKNLKECGVPLLLYDRTQLDSSNYHFSYALYSRQELSHPMNPGKYDYEVFGPNGFFRKFSGSNTPKIEIEFNNNSLKMKQN